MSSRQYGRAGSAGAGAGVGVLTFAIGYLLTYLWQAANVRESLEGYNFWIDLFGGDPIPAWKAVGWLYYNAQFVPFTHPTLGGGRGTANFVANGDAPALLYALPPLLLLGAGFLLARAADAGSPDAGARAGVRVVAGYVLFAVVGLFAFQHGAGGDAIHPQYATGVLLAGVVYPVVFGALGGVLGGVTST